jgi:ABC-type multidrug transport system fused ATPase/permease subunit
MLLIVFVTLMGVAASLSYTLIIRKLLAGIETDGEADKLTFLLLALATFAQVFFPNQGFHLNFKLVIKIKQATTVLIYKKLHSTNMSSLNEMSTGKIVNIIASDLARLY